MPHPSLTFPDVTYVRSEVSTTPPGTYGRRAGWITLAGAVAFGGGSAGAAVMARTSYDQFLQRLAIEGRWDPAEIREVENYRLATNLLLAGAVAAGAAGVLMLWLSDSPSDARVAIGPSRVEFTVSF